MCATCEQRPGEIDRYSKENKQLWWPKKSKDPDTGKGRIAVETFITQNNPPENLRCSRQDLVNNAILDIHDTTTEPLETPT